MKIDGGEMVVRMLKKEGVTHIFSLSGGSVSGSWERMKVPQWIGTMNLAPLSTNIFRASSGEA